MIELLYLAELFLQVKLKHNFSLSYQRKAAASEMCGVPAAEWLCLGPIISALRKH